MSLIFPTMKRTWWIPLTLLALAVLIAPFARAQSLKVDKPASLSAGANHGAVDSLVGEHFWTFTALPGHFRIAFTRKDSKEGFSVGGKAGVAAVFASKTPDPAMDFKDNASGTVFDGSVKQATRVIIMIEPPKSPLVRQTVDYTVEVTGDASFKAEGQ